MQKSRNGLAVALAAGVILGALLTGADPALGQPAVATPPPKPMWDSLGTIDLTLTRGNSRSFLVIGGLRTQKKWTDDEVLLGGGAGYGDTTSSDANGHSHDTKTQDFLKGFGQWNHLFTERFYSGLRLEGLHDDIASIDYRFILSPMAGYYLIKETNTSLSVEAGPSFVYQKLAGVESTYMGARVAERFEHKFETGAKIWESAEWIPQVDKVENWILNLEAGVSAPITKSLDARLVVQDSYNNRPADDRLKNDLKLMAGIGYKF